MTDYKNRLLANNEKIDELNRKINTLTTTTEDINKTCIVRIRGDEPFLCYINTLAPNNAVNPYFSETNTVDATRTLSGGIFIIIPQEPTSNYSFVTENIVLVNATDTHWALRAPLEKDIVGLVTITKD